MDDMKLTILAAGAAVGAFIGGCLGGWDFALMTLCIFATADFITGTGLAALGLSTKTETGFLSSVAMGRGLMQKFFILFLVLAAYRLDELMNTSYLREAVIFAFIFNELLSLTEHAIVLGLPIPAPLKNVIQTYHAPKQKNEKTDDKK
ncbi:phage holin family protein [Methanolapillus millepedarum]|uniref:Holin n=1 Tax=Methanolapillus millepedarum TaxID=3028296 RepID=A0AA96ZV00_9EURY|nr:hypothetical protein MsAc7_17520 [Methanosarcinaceae archaeon Ac7]